jgi:hypothetical protein
LREALRGKHFVFESMKFLMASKGCERVEAGLSTNERIVDGK